MTVFLCKKSGHTSGCMKSGYNYPCSHVESATGGTLFHRVRFGLGKASHIVFEPINDSNEMSSIQIGLRYGIRQPTAWASMDKVIKVMQSRQ